MRRLILLRHAHAAPPAAGQDDRDRTLSVTGEAEARAAATWLASNRLEIDRVVSSDAIRAKQTSDHVLAALGTVDHRAEPRIYDASPGELVDVAEGHRDADCVLLVGHNPGFEQLAALLATGQTGDYRGMPPAGVAVIDFPASDAPLEPGSGRITAFWSP